MKKKVQAALQQGKIPEKLLNDTQGAIRELHPEWSEQRVDGLITIIFSLISWSDTPYNRLQIGRYIEINEAINRFS